MSLSLSSSDRFANNSIFPWSTETATLFSASSPWQYKGSIAENIAAENSFTRSEIVLDVTYRSKQCFTVYIFIIPNGMKDLSNLMSPWQAILALCHCCKLIAKATTMGSSNLRNQWVPACKLKALLSVLNMKNNKNKVRALYQLNVCFQLRACSNPSANEHFHQSFFQSKKS